MTAIKPIAFVLAAIAVPPALANSGIGATDAQMPPTDPPETAAQVADCVPPQSEAIT